MRVWYPTGLAMALVFMLFPLAANPAIASDGGAFVGVAGTSAPIALDGARGVDVSYGSYWCDFEGRALGVGQWAIGGRPTSRIALWYARQTAVAKGRDRTNRFDTAIDWFGARWMAVGTERQGISIRYDGFRSDRGTAHLSAGADAVYPGPDVDCFTGVVSTAFRPSSPMSPVARLSFGIDTVRAFDKSVFGIRLGAGLTARVARGLTVDADVDGYIEYLSRIAGEASPAIRTRLSAGLSYRPAAWATIRAGADLAPGGMPYSGSSLAGMTSYMVYNPASGIAGLRSKSLAIASLGLTLTGSF